MAFLEGEPRTFLSWQQNLTLKTALPRGVWTDCLITSKHS
jgi:hypothetical protein